jgi:hypothetical protein
MKFYGLIGLILSGSYLSCIKTALGDEVMITQEDFKGMG